MSRRLALYALAEGVRAGTIEASLRALRGFDPWLAARARRRLRAALRRAGTLTSVQEAPHLLRLAHLIVATGLPASAFDDVAAIAAEQAALESAKADARRPRRGPWFVGAVGLALVFVVAFGLGWRWWTTPFDPRAQPVGEILAGPLPDLIVALSRGDAAAADRAAARAASGQARRRLGDDGARALAEVISAARSSAGLPAAASETERHRLTTAVVGLDRALAERGLPFFVDELSFAGERGFVPFTMSFYVERDVRVRAGDATVRVVHLWRLDPVNLAPGYLGYTQAHSPAALVLLDQVESDLVLYVLPTLPEGEPLTLLDRATRERGDAWGEELERRGGELIRRHVAALPAPELAGVEEVGRLLARRRALIRRWQGTLAQLGRELVVPERLIPEAAYERDLALRVPRAELYEWSDLHRSLRRAALLATFVRFRDLYVANVQRHEVEHRLDYARGLVPLPELLAAALGVEDRLDTPEGGLAARSRQELRAYLAEVAQAPHSPVLGLVLLGRHLFAPSTRGSAYWYAARVAFLGLAEELGIAAEHRSAGRIALQDSARLFLAVLGRDDATLRAATERLYRRAFGEPVPVVAEVADVRHRPWRH